MNAGNWSHRNVSSYGQYVRGWSVVFQQQHNSSDEYGESIEIDYITCLGITFIIAAVCNNIWQSFLKLLDDVKW